LGVANDGVVYTTCDYQAKNADELSFVKGRRLKVSRKGDGTESEWWWANVDGQQGYVPQNLLAVWTTHVVVVIIVVVVVVVVVIIIIIIIQMPMFMVLSLLQSHCES